MNFIELVETIRARPEMYFGFRSIYRFRAFLDGYSFGVSETDRAEFDKQLRNFQFWLVKKYQVKINQSWDAIILFHSRDELAAFDHFIELFDEFKNAAGNSKD